MTKDELPNGWEWAGRNGGWGAHREDPLCRVAVNGRDCKAKAMCIDMVHQEHARIEAAKARGCTFDPGTCREIEPNASR